MKCTGCGKEMERAASSFGGSGIGHHVHCDACTDTHPDGAMARMRRAMSLDGGLGYWKALSEAGVKCGILGCDGGDLVVCPHGCGNHYCPDHRGMHFHVVNPDGTVDPGPRLGR